jgi:alpha-mannosidase
VFNPLSWAVRAPVVLPHPAGAVTTDDGGQIAVQAVASREGTRYELHSVVLAELPPLGYRVFWLHRDASAAPGTSPDTTGGVVGSDVHLENEHLEVRIDGERGRITSIVSKRTRREWLAGEGVHPVVLDDPSDTWSHGVVGYDGAEQECSLVGHRLVEDGPLRAKVRLTYRWADSVVYADVILHATLDYLDVVLHVDWRQRQQLLKLVVPLAIEHETVTAGIPYGSVARSATGQEEVMLHWLDVSEQGAPSGVTCSSDSGYSYDANGSRLRFTVLRSPRFADHGQPWVSDDVIDQPATDQGWRSVAYRLRPHEGPVSGARQAEEQCTTPPVVTETWHGGTLGRTFSGIDVGPDNVTASVVKRAESGGGWIVRLVETEGRESVAHLSVSGIGRTWGGRLSAFEVKTLLLPDDASIEVGEVALTELHGVSGGE